MPKLNEREEYLNENDLYFKWLREGRVNFVDLLSKYVMWLENENKEQIVKNARYSNLLAQFIQYSNLTEKGEWVRDKAIGTLFAYEDFKGAPIYETWAEIIKRNNINTDLETLSYEVYTKDREIK